MWGLYTGYSRSTVQVQCSRCICSGAYASNVKCMYTSAPSDFIDCIEYIWGINTDIVV